MDDEIGGRWLVRGPASRLAPRARLFCFSYAGGGASAFRQWQAGLPPDLEVCAVQLPGREGRLREPALTRIATAVEALVPVLAPLLDRPFAFFGHSMGAVLATELTTSLSSTGGPTPAHLFVSARRAPGIPDPDPPLGALPDAEFLAELNRRYGGIPAEVMRDKEMMSLLLPSLRADISALENHRSTPQTRIAVPLSVFGGSSDSRVPRAHLEAWRHVASGGFRLRLFAGDHFYINPRRAELLAEVSATLAPMLGSAAS
jgi:medium-chain acyl-[acyl-carrier-protein] hydrolase